MKKYIVLVFAMAWVGAAMAKLYSYTKEGSETIDGVTWQYCVSNNEARIIDSLTLGSYSHAERHGNIHGNTTESTTYGNNLRLSRPTSPWYSDSGSSRWCSICNETISSYYYYYRSAISSSTTGAVVVPSELGGYPVVAVDYYAFGYCTGLTQVTIPEGVREIGPGAFYHCTELMAVNLPESLTKIDTCAFDNCTKLAKVGIPSTVKTIGDYAFRGCSAMTDVTISPGVETIDSYAFYGCSVLERLTVPSSVRTIKDHAFQSCSGMGSVVLPEGVETIANEAFRSCLKLSSVTIPSTVTNLGSSCFNDCQGLKKATITAELTAVPENLFSGCTSLQVVTLPESIDVIGLSAFYNCSSLTDVSIPAGVTEIGSSAFYGCRSLVDFKIPSGVTKIQDATFHGCSKLIGIDFPDGLLLIGSSAFYNCVCLTHADIPNTVTLINANAFVGCTGLERITLPGSINTMALGAFNCPNATVIFKDGVPNYSVSDAGLLNSRAISYPREYGAAWQKVLGTAQFGGYTQTQEELPEVVIVSAQMRPTDSTILDVVYRVKSKDSKVHVRVLAFEDGIRSFANVIRPETFVDDTAANVGDNITANEDHTISWRVSADWKTDLSKMKFEVLAMRNNYLPLELITIPAIEGHAAMTITWNSFSPAQIINALYWIYADKDINVSVSSGNLKQGTTVLMKGETLVDSAAALSYIYFKMGYSVLNGDKLTYARQATRLPLADDADCPFAVKND